MVSSLHTQCLVIGALLLRDMRTRVGRRHAGYLAVVAWPLCHMGITISIWLFLGRGAPLGVSSVQFYALSLLPYIVFSYPFRQIANAVIANKPMLYFPRVKIMDIMIARAILEGVSAYAITAVVVIIAGLLGEEFRPRDPFWTAMALLGAVYFGIALGMVNGLVAAMYPPWALVTSVLNPLFWVSSGSMWMVETFPSPYRDWLGWNPLLQCVELIRESYYTSYVSPVLNAEYVFWSGSIIIILVVAVERLGRGKILQF